MTPAQTETGGVQYQIDKSTSRFTVRAFASGMLSALGHNPVIAIRDFSGEVNFDRAAPEKASLRVEILAKSLEVTGDINSKDLKEMESTMNQRVLESGKYPTIIFASSEVSPNQLGEGRYQFKIAGSLLLHGITRSFPVTAQVTVAGDTLRAFGEFSVLQSDFGIPLASVAGGALRLKDELKFTFDIVARKKE